MPRRMTKYSMLKATSGIPISIRSSLENSIRRPVRSSNIVFHKIGSARSPTAAFRLISIKKGASTTATCHSACDPRPNSGGVWDPEAQATLIDLLVEQGAKVDHADKGGAVALHRAVRARSTAAVYRLLENGARVNVRLGKL